MLKQRHGSECPLQTSPRAWAAASVVLLALIVTTTGCASLGALALVRPPRFRTDPDRPAELRLLGPSLSRPLGGASVRLFARVENPNPFSLTLTTLSGRLLLEGTEAADVDLPLGLPLVSGQEESVPIDLSLSFENVPRLGEVLARAALGSELAYSLEGRVGVDAGPLGPQSFGPLTVLSGDVRVRR